MLLHRENTALLVVDIQERLVQVMERRDSVIKNTIILAKAAKALGVPILGTLQYPKGLGPMAGALDEVLEGATLVEKLTFDCCGEPAFLDKIHELSIRNVLLTGMEAHICVLQTAVSLHEHGLYVHVAGDAVCSRTDDNWRNGLDRMDRHGIDITNTESALFELLGKAGTPEFKELSKLVR